MAVRIVKDIVCDECGSDEGVRSYRVGVVGDGRGVSPDLCPEHAARLDETIRRLEPEDRDQVLALAERLARTGAAA